MNYQEEARMANLAHQFLQRTQLQGNEVPVYISVIQWLSQKGVQPDAQPPGPEIPAPAENAAPPEPPPAVQ